jgi:hypothetical protein
MLSRFVADLWARLSTQEDRYSFRITASMLELYGECVLDLLADDVLAFLPVETGSEASKLSGSSPARRFSAAIVGDSSSRTLRPREPLSIREDRVRGTVVVGLRNVRVRSASETFDVLRIGLRNRTTASTVLNDLSSRSHLVFFLQVCCDKRRQVEC